MRTWCVTFLALGFLGGLLVFGSAGCQPSECETIGQGGNGGTDVGGNGGTDVGGNGGTDAGGNGATCSYAGSYEFCSDGLVVCEICRCEYQRCTIAAASSQYDDVDVGFCITVDIGKGPVLTCSKPCNGTLCH